MRAHSRPWARVVRALATTSRAEFAFTARAAALAPLVEGSLAWCGLEGTLASIERITASRASRGAPSAHVVGRAAELAVARAFRVQPWLRGACLPRSLVRYALHRWDGADARFVIGVKRSRGGSFAAHAWVEPPAPADDPDFEPILVREVRS